MVCGRRWGKTALGLLATVRGHGPRRGALRGAIDGARIWWVARSYSDVKQQIWPDLKRACCNAWTKVSEIDHAIHLPGGGSITVRSADNPDSLRGVGLDGIVMDEAASMHESAWKEALRPTLSDRKGWAVFIGTPAGYNWFHDLYELAGNEDGWERWRRPSSDNPLMTPAELFAAKREIGSRAYRQEYEADFDAVGGAMFAREWLSVTDVVPRHFERIVRYWDKAATAKDTADYSAGVLIGAVPGFYGDEFYVLNVVRGQWSIEHRERIIKQTAELDRQNFGPQVVTWIEQEGGSAGPESAKNTIARLSGFTVRAEHPTGSKEVRAQPLAAQCEQGFVKLAKGYWNREFIDELVMFPTPDIHDDQVDAAAGAFAKVVKRGRFEIGVYG